MVGLVGESGSGKSTLAKAIVGLVPVAIGEILLDGETISGAGRSAREHRRRVQMVFQDPYSSLDPRMTIGESIAEALPAGASRPGRRAATRSPGCSSWSRSSRRAHRQPRQLSGGQRQRVAIARALAARPRS